MDSTMKTTVKEDEQDNTHVSMTLFYNRTRTLCYLSNCSRVCYPVFKRTSSGIRKLMDEIYLPEIIVQCFPYEVLIHAKVEKF